MVFLKPGPSKIKWFIHSKRGQESADQYDMLVNYFTLK